MTGASVRPEGKSTRQASPDARRLRRDHVARLAAPRLQPSPPPRQHPASSIEGVPAVLPLRVSHLSIAHRIAGSLGQGPQPRRLAVYGQSGVVRRLLSPRRGRGGRGRAWCRRPSVQTTDLGSPRPVQRRHLDRGLELEAAALRPALPLSLRIRWCGASQQRPAEASRLREARCAI